MFFRQGFKAATKPDMSMVANYARMDRARENRRRADLLGAARLGKGAYDWYADETGTSPISDQLREWGWMPEKDTGTAGEGASPGIQSMMDQSALYEGDTGYMDPEVASIMDQYYAGGGGGGLSDAVEAADAAATVADTAEAADTASTVADVASSAPGIGAAGYAGTLAKAAGGAEADELALDLAKKYLLSTMGPAGIVAGLFV